MTTPTLTLDALIEWLEQQPTAWRLATCDDENCPVARYLREQIGYVDTIYVGRTTYSAKSLDVRGDNPPEIAAFIRAVDAQYQGEPITAATALAIARRVRERWA